MYNVATLFDKLLIAIPSAHWKAFKKMEAIVNNSSIYQPFNYNRRQFQYDQLISIFVDTSLKYIDAMKVCITHKLLSHAMEQMREESYNPITFKQFLEDVREKSAIDQTINMSREKIIREKAHSLENIVKEIVKDLKGLLGISKQSRIDTIEKEQSAAVLSAIYLGLATNLNQASDKELYDMVKSEVRKLLSNYGFYNFQNWVYIPKASQEPKSISSLKFALKMSVRPVLIVDPMSLTKSFFQKVKFRKFKDLQPSDLSPDDVYICHYENPVFNKWVWDSFTVFYVSGFEQVHEKEENECVNIYDFEELQLKLQDVQSQVEELIKEDQSQPRQNFEKQKQLFENLRLIKKKDYI
ncbi:hypothetical protein FGO68_gene1651 [Halteria grandinella]|uniref:Uncharacterized protein n=1 Tax=Halteria grandinella TaxID=5974 RepID=A0A8J8NVP1_HALGN|nr:hypothetical protein FGO68_gene1651 [Halteria grandinella]